MKVSLGLSHFNTTAEKQAATIGNFDGIHLGHQALLLQLIQTAKKNNQRSLLITFEPYAKEFFNPQKAPARLTSLREKIKLLKPFELDHLLCLPFNRKFAAMPAEQFISEILVKRLNIAALSVGSDFQFGHNRDGNVELLTKLAQQYHFDFNVFADVELKGQRISSSFIRQHLAQGDFQQAAGMLGRDFSICGKVIHGDKLGQRLGFPTANVHLNRINPPFTGVFAVKVLGASNRIEYGAANIGLRPTVDGKALRFEIHIIDFAKDIYGKQIEVVFMHKIREDMKFNSVEELRQAIANDVEILRRDLKAGKYS